MASEMTFREAIKHVLSSATPMHYEDITQQIIAEGLKKTVGATPSASVNAHICSSIKHEGSSSPYVRVAKGIYTLASLSAIAAPPVGKLTPSVNESIEVEEQYEVVTSLGMYWRREAVEWSSNPK